MHFACFFSCKIKDLRLKQAYASLCMQNMYVERLIENFIAKNFVESPLTKFMIYLAWVVNSVVIFSASYVHCCIHQNSGIDLLVYKLME